MKKPVRFLCLALAALLGISAFSCPSLRAEAAETAAQALTDQTPLAVFDGEPITYAEVVQTAYNLLEDSDEYVSGQMDNALERAIQSRLIDAKIKEMGLDQFTAEEEEAFLTEAQKEWDEAVQSYVDYFLSEDTEEARAKAREDGDAYFRALGYSVEALADSLRYNASLDLLWDSIATEKDLEVTDDEIQALFEDIAAQDKAAYENSPGLYEMYKAFYGYDSWYTPEGYRGIIHILLQTDEELLSAFQAAQAAFEETVTDATPAGDSELLAALNAARQAVLDSKKTEIDDIYSRLEKGESFESLIAEYGTDPGMTDESTLKEGYPVHRESIMWDSAFTAAAFSEKMTKPGDTADPTVGSYGIHILHYLRDIPGGYVELSDEIRGQIREYLASVKQNEVIVQALKVWETEHEIVRYDDVIAAAKNQAVAEQVQAMENDQD